MIGRGVVDGAEIPTYRDFISHELLIHLADQRKPVDGVANMWQVGASGDWKAGNRCSFFANFMNL